MTKITRKYFKNFYEALGDMSHEIFVDHHNVNNLEINLLLDEEKINELPLDSIDFEFIDFVLKIWDNYIRETFKYEEEREKDDFVLTPKEIVDHYKVPLKKACVEQYFINFSSEKISFRDYLLNEVLENFDCDFTAGDIKQ